MPNPPHRPHSQASARRREKALKTPKTSYAFKYGEHVAASQFPKLNYCSFYDGAPPGPRLVPPEQLLTSIQLQFPGPFTSGPCHSDQPNLESLRLDAFARTVEPDVVAAARTCVHHPGQDGLPNMRDARPP